MKTLKKMKTFKEVFLLLILLNITTSCSESETNEEQNSNEFPNNITLSTENIGIGDTLIINSDNFTEDESYIITFSNNIPGEVIETNSNFIKVIVPENAESGSISLTVDNQTEIIGNITITLRKIFLFNQNNDEEQKLVEYDINSSSQTTITTLNTIDFNHFDNYGSMASIYHQSKNEIIGIIDFNKLLRVNLSNGTYTSTILSDEDYESYKGLIITPDEKIYMFKRNDTDNTGDKLDLISYDLETETETIIINDSEYYDNFSEFSDISAIYNSTNNEIITLIDRNTLLKANLSNNTISTTELSTEDYVAYKGLTITSNNEVYMIKRDNEERSLIRYDIDSSTESFITYLDNTTFENTYTSFGDISTIYNSDTNEIIALMGLNTLLKINISDNTVSTDTLTDIQYDHYKGIVIK